MGFVPMITIMHLNLENESSLLPWQLINSTMTLYMESIDMQGVLTENDIAGGGGGGHKFMT